MIHGELPITQSNGGSIDSSSANVATNGDGAVAWAE
jgi:hypothetical protein